MEAVGEGRCQRCGDELAWPWNDFSPGYRQCELVQRFEAAS
jgi:hypothetical protein